MRGWVRALRGCVRHHSQGEMNALDKAKKYLQERHGSPVPLLSGKVYVPAEKSDVRKTFERLKKEQERKAWNPPI